MYSTLKIITQGGSKLYINSTHLKIVKFILETSNFDYKNLSDFLNIASYTLNNHLKDIESIITQNKPCLSFDERIALIKKNTNIISILKKEQYITKEEKKDYILFLLLDQDNINLTNLTSSLNISRRSLNYYLKDLKGLLESKSIFIKKYSNTGIFLDGNLYNKKKLLFGIGIKFFIEKNEAPKEIRSIVAKMLCDIKNNRVLQKFKDYRINSQNFIHLNKNTFIPYLYISKKNFEEDIDSINEDYNNFMNEIMAKTPINSSNFEKSIQTFFNLEENHDLFSNISLKKWKSYYLFKEQYNVNDLTLSCNLINEFPNDILNFRKHLKDDGIKLGVYESIGIYFLIKESLQTILKNSTNYILVYKYVPECILFIAKSKLEKIYNFNFKNVINYSDLSKFVKNDKTSSIVYFENFNLSSLENNCIYIPLFSLI